MRQSSSINNNNIQASGKTSGVGSGVEREGGSNMVAGVTFANDQNAVNKCGRLRASRDHWDGYRDRKLDEMKAHKLNVERRMQKAHNIDSQMYWSQRSDKLKRYPKHEALDPSWYTDNIYANSSIELEDEDFTANTEKYDAFYPYNYYGINDYVHDMFERRKAYHKQHADSGDYNYPKSRSCCFGSGYDERPKPNLMPKSSSFSASTSTRAIANNTARHPYRIEEEDDFHDQRPNANDFGQSSIRKFYCWEQRQQRRTNDQRKEIYHIDGDPSNYKRHNDVDDMVNANRPNTNCIRNIWQHNRAARPTAPATTNFKVNNNELNRHEFDEPYDEPYDSYRKKMPPRNGHQHHSFDEEYLIVHQNKSPADHYSHAIRRNYSDEMLSISRRQSQHSNVLDPIYDEECTKLLNNDHEYEHNANVFTLDDLNGCHRGSVKSKSALEVKPPKRFDDSSSDSTDLDLDDFNFDFEKYWNELDKTTTSDSSDTLIAAAPANAPTNTNATIDRYDTEYRNNKCNFINAKSKNINSNFKQKNINVDKYKKKCGQNIDVNLNDDDIDCDDDDDDDNIIGHDDDEDDDIDIIDDDDLMLDYRDHQRFKDNFLADGFMSPQRNASPALRSRYPANEICDNDRVAVSTRYENTYHRTQAHNAVDDPVNNNVINNNNISDTTRGNGTGPISLINNIFSIYKPRKYSPVNCRAPPLGTSGGHPKSGTMSKCMNVPSTVRPLGAPYNDFMTSMKRPLTITPTCYTSKRTWGGPSPTIDQPYFKIIPQKTGLKISPLYRFGFDDDDSKLRLKCTARPLLFPI